MLRKNYIAFITLIISILFVFSAKGQTTPPNHSCISHLSLGEENKGYIIETIREATESFREQQNAEKAGYRPFGPDMPNMGRHWIFTRLAVNRKFDLCKPSTLTYLTVKGKPILTGVAYTFPVQSGEKPPSLPLKNMRWHYHSEDLEEEAHGIHHNHSLESHSKKVRLAMVHAWVWSENPDGVFAADNWALSYLRFGLKPPEKPKEGASKALFLASAGIDYFQRFIELSILPDRIPTDKVRTTLDHHSSKISRYATSLQNIATITDQHQDHLIELWTALWEDIKLLLGKDLWPKISRHLFLADSH